MNDVISEENEIPEQKEITSQQVWDHLVKHPTFFETNSHLLTKLQINHQSGQSISLIERQIFALRKENQQLKRQLDTIISNAKRNDQLLEKIKALILKLLMNQSCEEIQSAIETILVKQFGSSACKLLLLTDTPSAEGLSHKTASTQLTRLIEGNHPYCGLLREQEKQLLFTSQSPSVGSAAILPLRHDDTVIAILAIGHTDENYYRKNMSTTLLSYIGQVTAILLSK